MFHSRVGMANGITGLYSGAIYLPITVNILPMTTDNNIFNYR